MWPFKKKDNANKLDIIEEPGLHDGHCYMAGSMRVTGDVVFSGTFRVDGRIDGKVAVHAGKKGSVILSKGSVVNGPVQCSELVCDGSILGDVNVSGRLELRPHAVIRGAVQYGSIHIAEGARLEGRCVQHSNIAKNTHQSLGAKPQAPTHSGFERAAQQMAGTTQAAPMQTGAPRVVAGTSLSSSHAAPAEANFLKKAQNS